MRFQHISKGAVIIPPIRHEIKGGSITKIRAIYVDEMEDEHGNAISEYTYDTWAGQFSENELELLGDLVITE